MDSSPYKGTYEMVNQSLNVQAFLNTSRWWSRFVNDHDLPSSFVRMGMLPEYCVMGKQWQDRSINLGFQGSLHPHRKDFFDYLASQDCEVTFTPSVPYKKFLKRLNDMQIYIYNEDVPWTINGTLYARNAGWVKCVESAARGCFTIRDYEEESASFAIDEIPTIYTFKSRDEVPAILETINAMPLKEKNGRMQESVYLMKQRDDWMTVIHAMTQATGN